MPPPYLTAGDRVAVIGAGSVGVFAAKELLAAGLDVVVFEKGHEVGGVWRPASRGGNAYDSLHTNSSNTLMGVSDYPFPFETTGRFPMAGEIRRYVAAYAADHGITSSSSSSSSGGGGKVRFGVTVVGVRRLPHDGESHERWEVTSELSDGGTAITTTAAAAAAAAATTTERFAAVFCCTGQYGTPSLPPRRLFASFTGRVIHSSQYESGSALRGKSVLVVGIGNSALDIALEAARSGAALPVRVACRSGAVMLPVADSAGQPRDAGLLTRFYSNVLPAAVRGAHFALSLRHINNVFQAAGLPALGPGDPMKHRISNLKEHRLWEELLKDGKIVFVGAVESAEGRTVTCGASKSGESGKSGKPGSSDDRASSSTTFDVDEVVCCTGYQLSFPFLSADIMEKVTTSYKVGPAAVKTMATLHRRVMALEAGEPTLCFFGQLSTLGNEACVGEMQARWAIASLTGTAARAMRIEEDTAACAAKRAQLLRRQPMYPGFANYVKYMDALAADIGCDLPALSDFQFWATRPSLWLKGLLGPVVPTWYRLRGPGKWDGAEKYLLSRL